MVISIFLAERHVADLTAEEMAVEAGAIFPLASRVPGAEGDAFDVKTWFFRWQEIHSPPPFQPSHITVRASDSFQATIPWQEMDQATIRFRSNQPRQETAAARLYIPDGSSKCLNVKGVAALYFVNDPTLAKTSTYGFKNMVRVSEMMKKDEP